LQQKHDATEGSVSCGMANGAIPCRASLRIVHSKRCESGPVWFGVAAVVEQANERIMTSFRSHKAGILKLAVSSSNQDALDMIEMHNISLQVVQESRPIQIGAAQSVEESSSHGGDSDGMELNVGGWITVIMSGMILVGVAILVVIGCRRMCCSSGNEQKKKKKKKSTKKQPLQSTDGVTSDKSSNNNNQLDKWQSYVSKVNTRALQQSSSAPSSSNDEETGNNHFVQSNNLETIDERRSSEGTETDGSSMDGIECGVFSEYDEIEETSFSDNEHPIVTTMRRIAVVAVDTLFETNSRKNSGVDGLLSRESSVAQCSNKSLEADHGDVAAMEAVETSLHKGIDPPSSKHDPPASMQDDSDRSDYQTVKIESNGSPALYLDVEAPFETAKDVVTAGDKGNNDGDDEVLHRRAADDSIAVEPSKQPLFFLRHFAGRFHRPSVKREPLDSDPTILDEADPNRSNHDDIKDEAIGLSARYSEFETPSETTKNITAEDKEEDDDGYEEEDDILHTRAVGDSIVPVVEPPRESSKRPLFFLRHLTGRLNRPSVERVPLDGETNLPDDTTKLEASRTSLQASYALAAGIEDEPREQTAELSPDVPDGPVALRSTSTASALAIEKEYPDVLVDEEAQRYVMDDKAVPPPSLSVQEHDELSMIVRATSAEGAETAGPSLVRSDAWAKMVAKVTSVLDASSNHDRPDEKGDGERDTRSREPPGMTLSSETATWNSSYYSADADAVTAGFSSEVRSTGRVEKDDVLSTSFSAFSESFCRQNTVLSDECSEGSVNDRTTNSQEFNQLWSERSEASVLFPVSYATEEATSYYTEEPISEHTEEPLSVNTEEPLSVDTEAVARSHNGENEERSEDDDDDEEEEEEEEDDDELSEEAVEYSLATFEADSVSYVRSTPPPDRHWSWADFKHARSVQL
jgi:hypothetical protein